MTVSLALRNQPNVGTELRGKILAIAERLGYQPDARVAAWLNTVRAAKARSAIPLAWLTTDTEKDIWHTYAYNSPYFVGAQESCRRLGYTLDELWLREPGMTMRRMSQILYHRGIRGIIVSPPVNHHLGHVNLNWSHFAAASFERGILAPRLHRVSSDYFYNLTLALKRLRRSGYQKIGLCLPQQINRRTNHACLAWLSYFHSQISRPERVPAFVHAHRSIAGKEFYRWMSRYRPDAVVCQHSGMISWIKEAGFAVPDEVGVVHLTMEDDCTDWAGIWGNRREVGAATAELVISLIENNQFGLPAIPRDTLVPGFWKNGRTLLTPKPASFVAPDGDLCKLNRRL